MAYTQLLAPPTEMTATEVTFVSGHRAIIIITNAADIVVGWINDAVNSYGPPAGANGHVVVGLHIKHTNRNTIGLLQLCVGDWCLLYQLRHRGKAMPPARLQEFLDDDRFCFAGVAMERTVNALRTEYGLTVRAVADLGDEASRRLQRYDLRWATVDQLVREMMGIVIIRTGEVRQHALLKRVLPLEHIPLACIDSVFSYELGRILLG